jgi:hypothetical protein
MTGRVKGWHQFLTFFSLTKNLMSQAFIREGDDQWLNEIAPTTNALIHFLTRENGGIRVYEQKRCTDKEGRDIHYMSNGLGYFKDDNGTWQILDEV